MWTLSRDLKEEEEPAQKRVRKSLLGRGNSICKA